MTGAGRLFQQACDVFGARVEAVPSDAWNEPTPCAEWDVRALVNHVVVEDLWAPSLLAGKTISDVGDAFDGDQLGNDPAKVAGAAIAAAKAAAAEPDVEKRTVHLSYGDDSAEAYLMQIFTDNLIHAWDLASAIGGDTTLPEDLVAECAAWFANWESTYRSMGVIGSPVPTAADADTQTKLLAAFGRNAG
jgi:uncharacterized protein (TIGR03086 family)